MKTALRGRPRLGISLKAVLDAIRRYRNVTRAAAALGCSPAYVHAALKRAGLTLGQVLEGGDTA